MDPSYAAKVGNNAEGPRINWPQFQEAQNFAANDDEDLYS